jgi:hypothetical protein
VRAQTATVFAALLTGVVVTGWPVDISGQPVQPKVLVMLQNPARAPADVVARAQAEVARLYALIGVEITWVTAVPEAGTRLRVVSLTTWEPKEDKIPATVLGYTQAGLEKRGIRAYVFWGRVERASLTFTASLHQVLAIAVAHEIGHMLLPDDSHAKSGLMQAPWNSGHFRSASAGLLHFAPDSAKLIRQGLIDQVTISVTRPPD